MQNNSIKFVYFVAGIIMGSLAVLFAIKVMSKGILPEPTTSEQSYTQILAIRNEINSHDSYQEVDLSSNRLSAFREAYQTAVSNQENWVENPWAVVFEFTGYPNEEVGNPGYLYVFYPQDNVAIALLYDRSMSDTASGIEWRVDLNSNNGIWSIIWAGHRQRCSRTLDDGWTKGSCP
jgi:hypothetical protein